MSWTKQAMPGKRPYKIGEDPQDRYDRPTIYRRPERVGNPFALYDDAEEGITVPALYNMVQKATEVMLKDIEDMTDRWIDMYDQWSRQYAKLGADDTMVRDRVYKLSMKKLKEAFGGV